MKRITRFGFRILPLVLLFVSLPWWKRLNQAVEYYDQPYPHITRLDGCQWEQDGWVEWNIYCPPGFDLPER